MLKRKTKIIIITGSCVLAVLLAVLIFFLAAVVGYGGDYKDKDGAYARATTRSSVRWTMEHPAFAEYGDFILTWHYGVASRTTPWSSYFWMCVTTDWNADDVVSGVNFMIGGEEEGYVDFYRFYTDEEIAADESKAETGLIFVRGDADKPLAFVVPGGGFTSVAVTGEGFTAARELHAQGYNVAILKYRVSENGMENGQEKIANADMGRAINWLCANEAVTGASMDGYSVWGYSAGGRLCYLWGLNNEFGYAAHGAPAPAAAVLAYSGWHEEKFADAYTSASPTFFSYTKRDKVIGAELVTGIETYIARLDELTDTEVFACESAPHGYGTGAGTDAAGWMTGAYAFWEGHRGAP